MIRGLRQIAARHIEDLQRIEGKKQYTYNTIYNGLKWNPATDSYYFEAKDDCYSFSINDIDEII